MLLGAVLTRPVSAANMAAVQAPKGPGVTGAVVVAPVNSGGPSLSNGLGSADMKGALQGLTGVAPSGVLPGLRLSKPDIFSDLGLPSAKVGFRPDVAPPALPGSAIPGVESAPLPQGTFNPAVPAAAAVQTMSEFGLAHGRTRRLDLPDGGFKPGPGSGLRSMDRQSVRLAAKAEAVREQLKAAAGAGEAAAEEGAQGLGVRLMDILTDESNWSGSSGIRTPAIGSSPGSAGSKGTQRPGARLLGHGSLSGGSEAAAVSALSYGVPGVSNGYWLAYRRSSDEGSAASLGGVPADVALLALKVSRESLKLSVVDAPARRLARRLAEDSALAMSEFGRPATIASAFVSGRDLRDAVASPAVAEPSLLVPLGAQVQSAQSEVYAFLQAGSPALESAAHDPAAVKSADAVPLRGDLGGGSGPAPLSVPDPLLAAGLLPFVSLLILRSRLFS